jgi:hypothetical protein
MPRHNYLRYLVVSEVSLSLGFISTLGLSYIFNFLVTYPKPLHNISSNNPPHLPIFGNDLNIFILFVFAVGIITFIGSFLNLKSHILPRLISPLSATILAILTIAIGFLTLVYSLSRPITWVTNGI